MLCQIASVLVWRTSRESLFSKGILRNRTVVAGIALEMAVVAFIVFAPTGQALFGTQAVVRSCGRLPVVVGFAMIALAELF